MMIVHLLPFVFLTACAGENQRVDKTLPFESECAALDREDEEACGTQSWRRRAGVVVSVPELDLLVSGLTAYSAETGETLWSHTLHVTEDVRGSNRGRTHILSVINTSDTLKAFGVHDGVVLYADELHAGTADVHTGEEISIIGGYGSFDVAWDREVIQRGEVAYSADQRGVTVADASRSQFIPDARLLACDAHDVLVLVDGDGAAQSVAADGTRKPMAAIPTSDRVHRLYSSDGVVKAAVADGTDIRADGACWTAQDEVGELFVTPFGVAGMEYNPSVKWKDRDDPTFLGRFHAVVFFPFPEKRDVAQCRWVTSVPRLVDTRPIVDGER